MTSAKCVERVIEHTLDALELARRAGLSDSGILSTREDGASFRECLEQELDSLPPTGLLRLDFRCIQLMDASFADAALAVLALSMAKGTHKERYMLLVGLKKASLQNLECGLDSRLKREEKQVRNLILAILTPTDNVEISGKLEDHLTKPLEFVRNCRCTTARDLATALDLDVAAASTKLKTLFDLRLLRREEVRDESGKQYVYRFFL